MKRIHIIIWLIALVVFFGMVQPAMAARMSLSVNDQPIFMDQQVYARGGKTFVPVRFLTQALGAKGIAWDPDTESVVITDLNDRQLILRADCKEANHDGRAFVFTTPLPMRDGRLYVPIRDLANKLDFSISFDSENHVVQIYKSEIDVASIKEPNIDQETLTWLARIVHVESNGQPMETQLAVANVVLNRVASHSFPNNVHDVIFQKAGSVQFPPAHKSSFSKLIPSGSSFEAAKAALLGKNNIENCLFFNNRPWSHMSDRLYTSLNGEYFYR